MSKVRQIRPGQRKQQQQPPAAPRNVAAQLVITAYTDRQPDVVCSAGADAALKLIAVAVNVIADSVGLQFQSGPPQPEDKPREYLGPRKYDKNWPEPGGGYYLTEEQMKEMGMTPPPKREG